jgi:hypothetical protein
MSISPTYAPPLPSPQPQVDLRSALQAQARVQVAVPPTAVTTASRQDGAGGFAKPDSHRGAPAGGRGRLVDITA